MQCVQNDGIKGRTTFDEVCAGSIYLIKDIRIRVGQCIIQDPGKRAKAIFIVIILKLLKVINTDPN